MKPTNTAPLSESDIKAIAIARLLRTGRITPNAIIANEYRLGSSGVRADLAVLDKRFIGLEVKSDRDSLRRLASQVKAYERYFDRTILVLAERHIPNLEIDLSGIELWSVGSNGSIKTISKPTHLRSVALREHLVDLLPSRQRARILESKQGVVFRNLTTELFRAYFTDRFTATSRAFWDSTSNRDFEGADLSSLSVYKPIRNKAAEMAEKRAATLKRWGR
ncbi:sce7726 family protein [Xanthomonas sacchari]|uniref:sce7726 family protein n=1 Tax=Xanthomonas sacchari TaxID=56458 RepID=UPI003D1880F6